jgi:protein SCO1/2
MKQKKTILLFLIAAIALPFAAYAVLTFYENKFQRLPVYGEAKKINGKKIEHHIADFSFTNQDGKIVTSASWSGKIVVANFFFTRCPSICPKMMVNMKKTEEYFRNDPEILFNSFSVDPENDSVKRLKSHASSFNINTDNWSLLTGNKKEIYKLARNSFLVVATNGDGGPTDFIHSDKLILIDTEKRIRGYYDGTDEKEVNKLINDIKKLKNEN